jgi:hypothetical protein
MKLTLITFLIALNGCLTAQVWLPHTLQFNSTSTNTDEYQTMLDLDGNGSNDIVFGNAYRKELFLLENSVPSDSRLTLLTDTLYGILGLHGCNYNNDGLDDFIIGASTTLGDGLWLCVNQGNNQFEWIYVCYVAYEGVKKMITDDFDGDGDMDVVYDDRANSNVIWTVTNNGDGTFTQFYIEYTGQPTGLFGAWDMDTDGDTDLLTTYFDFGSSTFRLVAEENIGAMNFVSHVGPSLTGSYSGIIGDFVGDDQLDLLVSSTANPGVFYENLGNFTFEAAAVNAGVSAYDRLGPADDFDNDGDTDYAVVSGSDLLRMTHNANGTFSSTLWATGFYGGVVYNEDLNTDGLKDFVTEEREIWIQTDQTFTNAYTSYLGATSPVVAAHWSEDGNFDLLAGAAGGQLSHYEQRYDESVAYVVDHYMTGNGIDFSTPVKEMVVYDRDNDGKDDVLCLVANYMFWLSKDNGTFVQTTVSNAMAGYEAWVGDLDNDGMHDILVYDGDLKRWEWNGNSYASSTLNTSVTDYFGVLDVDEDGDQDVVYFSWDINAQEWELYYLKNNNNTTFVNTYVMNMSENFPIEFTLIGNCEFKVSDLDQDGDEDWVFASGEQSFTDDSDFLAWLRNEEGEPFTPLLITDEVGQFRDFDIGDFDMDGDLDVVSSVGEDTSLLMHYQMDDQTFEAVGISAMASAPLHLHARDMDNDSDLDVVFGSTIDRRLGWLENGVLDCPRSYNQTTAQVCPGDSVAFANSYYYESGFYADTLQASSGCDSVQVLFLDVLNLPSVVIQNASNILSTSASVLDGAWYFENVIVSNALSIDAADFGVGGYQLIGTSSEGCTLQSNILEVTTIISVEDFEKNQLVIGPVPTTDNLWVQSKEILLLNYALFDVKGNLLFQGSANGCELQLDLSALSSGPYLICIEMANGHLYRELVQKK